ncbi:MAG: isochorismatase family protein [Gammaproteobacteria bacterium]
MANISNHGTYPVRLEDGDALIAIDLQNDFLPGGTLAVAGGDEVIPVMKRCLKIFRKNKLPVFATRDWHPADHSSFRLHGGPWPAHCVAGTKGAEFTADFDLPDSAFIISTGVTPEYEGYSGFENTELKKILDDIGVKRLFIGGIATDYCVLRTVLDARRYGFDVLLLTDAIRAVDVNPEDGKNALRRMTDAGAKLITSDDLA